MFAANGMTWEYKFIEWFQNIGSGFGDFLQGCLSAMGEEIFIILVLGFVYWCYDKKTGAFLGLSLFASACFNGMVKNIVKRPRPYESDEFLIQNKRPLESMSYSYPSGHSQSIAAISTGTAIAYQKKWILTLCCVVPFLVAQSRIYLGMHFPSDVIGGLAFGLLSSIIVYNLFAFIKNKYVVYAILILISVPGIFFLHPSNPYASDYFKSLGMLLGCIGGLIFEERFVNFTNTRNAFRAVARLLFGIAVVALSRWLLKLIFDLISPNSGMLDGLRYLVVMFIGFGVFPLGFRVGDIWFGRDSAPETVNLFGTDKDEVPAGSADTSVTASEYVKNNDGFVADAKKNRQSGNAKNEARGNGNKSQKNDGVNKSVRTDNNKNSQTNKPTANKSGTAKDNKQRDNTNRPVPGAKVIRITTSSNSKKRKKK